MRSRIFSLVAVALVAAACATPGVDTLPPPVSPRAPTQYYDLEVPADLEVRSIDFSATTYSDVSGTAESGPMTTVNGRAFVQVRAVHRVTGELYLLVYEDPARRKQPIQVIRFVAGARRARPDSTR